LATKTDRRTDGRHHRLKPILTQWGEALIVGYESTHLYVF